MLPLLLACARYAPIRHVSTFDGPASRVDLASGGETADLSNPGTGVVRFGLRSPRLTTTLVSAPDARLLDAADGLLLAVDAGVLLQRGEEPPGARFVVAGNILDGWLTDDGAILVEDVDGTCTRVDWTGTLAETPIGPDCTAARFAFDGRRAWIADGRLSSIDQEITPTDIEADVVAAADGVVLTATPDEVRASGGADWATEVDFGAPVGVALARGRAFVSFGDDDDGTWIALDADTGQINWTVDAPSAAALSIAPDASMLAVSAEDHVFFYEVGDQRRAR
jgi:outer membrane protein assembly factor BamB